MHAIIFFDGVCNLCNKAVQFIIRHDRHNFFKFASQQSAVAEKYLGGGLTKIIPGSVVLMKNEKLLVKSDAVLQIAKQLKFPVNLLYGFIIVPRFIRDRAYDYIAKHRYHWFGKKDECMVPHPSIKSKFLH